MRARTIFAALLGLLVVFDSENAGANQEVRTVTLVRAACYGNCPVYSIVVHPNALVEYEGEAHVRVIGKETAIMTASDHQALMKAIDASQFEALASRFQKGGECVVPDSSFVSVSVVSGVHEYRISHDVACVSTPSKKDAERFMKLANEIDSVVGAKRWTDFGAKDH